MFVIGIIEAVGSITSICMIRFGSGVCISTDSGFDIGLGFSFSDIVAGEV